MFYPRFFSVEQKIMRLEKVYDSNFPLIYVSIVEQKDYATSVQHEAFNVIVQFDEPNNRETTEK